MRSKISILYPTKGAHGSVAWRYILGLLCVTSIILIKRWFQNHTATDAFSLSECEVTNNGDNELVLALHHGIMTAAECGRTVHIDHKGKKHTGVVVDKCTGCDNLDSYAVMHGTRGRHQLRICPRKLGERCWCGSMASFESTICIYTTLEYLNWALHQTPATSAD